MHAIIENLISIRRRKIILLRLLRDNEGRGSEPPSGAQLAGAGRAVLAISAAPLSAKGSVVIFRMMKFLMSVSVVKRLVLALTAVAFVFATMQANCIDASG